MLLISKSYVVRVEELGPIGFQGLASGFRLSHTLYVALYVGVVGNGCW